jgi:hypothetical protein
MRIIVTKPHHLLDIIKLYGAGREHFVPDPAFGHDFYRVGNDVLAYPEATLKFVVGGDDICEPCRYYEDGKCTDVVGNNSGRFRSKEIWNKTIDERLMKILGIKEGDTMTVIEYCKLALDKLSTENIATVWHERPTDETARRAELLIEGLNKYIQTKSYA